MEKFTITLRILTGHSWVSGQTFVKHTGNMTPMFGHSEQEIIFFGILQMLHLIVSTAKTVSIHVILGPQFLINSGVQELLLIKKKTERIL